MKTLMNLLLVCMTLGMVLTSCSKDKDLIITPSSDSNGMISSFVFLLSDNPITINVLGTIDEDNKTITAFMPPNTDITALFPTIKTAKNTQVSPDAPQDFSNPVEYTVIAEDGSEVVYVVSIDVALSQRQILQAIMDANPGNTLDWDLQNTRDLGTLGGITTNVEGLITKMFLSSKMISQLPSETGQLTKLKILGIQHNPLTSIPSEIGQLTNLTRLTLFNNHLTAIPSEIGQLISLEELNLSGNQLTSIPSKIGQLTNLVELNLYRNQLTFIPSEIGQLTNLIELHLAENQLTSVPPEIGQLTSLQKLSLAQNQLTTIPSQIGQLTNLTRLSFTNNKLKTIPSEIGFLTNLISLSIHENQLTEIPQAICYLKEYNKPNMTFIKDAGTPCGITSPKDAFISIYSSNPNNALGWSLGNFPGASFDGNQSLTKLEIQNKGIQRIPACGDLFEFCKLLDVRNNPFITISSEVCALRFTSTVGFSILTDPGSGCN